MADASLINNNNVVKDDFDEFFNDIILTTFIGLNLTKLEQFYLKNIDLDNSTAIKWQIYNAFGDLLMKCPTYFFAKRYAEECDVKTNVFAYEFADCVFDVKNEAVGVRHGSDVSAVFGLPLLNATATEEDKEFSRTVIKYWTNFAKYGLDSGNVLISLIIEIYLFRKPSEKWPRFLKNGKVDHVKSLNKKSMQTQSNFYLVCEEFWKNYFL